MPSLVKHISIVCCILVIGCDNPLQNDNDSDDVDTTTLDVYMELELDSNGYYLFDYPNESNNSYTYVKYTTSPVTRIFWSSPDSFTVVHQGFPFTEPIINYSTYSDGDGNGQQMIYVYQEHIGDTLQVIGSYSESVHDDVSFIVF